MRSLMGFVSVVIAILFATTALGQSTTLYKHVDKDGKVTYTDKPPAKGEEERKDGTVTKRLGMDNERNVIKAPPKALPTPEGQKSANRKREDLSQKERNLEDAKDAYNQARQALEDGKEPLDDEWQTVGAAKGKPSRIPSEAYHARIRKLEEAVTQATNRVRDAERALRD